MTSPLNVAAGAAAVAAQKIASSAASTPSSSSATLGSLSVVRRPSSTRGHANHGWLNSYHTFSFANYYDPKYESLHSLRVINEDRVAPSQGFGKHPHRDFEIFSLIINGRLRHKDSMGNLESLGRGSVQFTSAGSGIAHSEYNDSDEEDVHFLQIWVKPDRSGLKPSYSTRHWTDEQKANQLALLVSQDGREGSIPIHQDISVYSSILSPTRSVDFTVQPGRDVLVHLVQDVNSFDTEANKTGLTITDAQAETKLESGDGAVIRLTNANAKQAQTFRLTGSGKDGAKAEFVLFDIKTE